MNYIPLGDGYIVHICEDQSKKTEEFPIRLMHKGKVILEDKNTKEGWLRLRKHVAHIFWPEEFTDPEENQ